MELFRCTLSLLLAANMLLSAFPAGARAAEDEAVTLIVRLEDRAVLESEEARSCGAVLFSQTDSANAIEKNILTEQEKLQSRIKSEINDKAEIGYTYTTLFNGFSLDAKTSDIEKIKELPGVKDVYISHTYKMPSTDDIEASLMSAEEEEVVLSCCDEMNVGYMHEHGYNGEGQVIAVIDDSLDYTHEMFAGEVENPRYDLADIEAMLSEQAFNVDVSAKRVYRSSKLPFVYNYSKKNTDTHENHLDHGTHVAGIAAGKNGKIGDDRFSGVAPEAQIVFMGISGDMYGSTSDESAVAALDDAAKLGVCAINCSFGTDGKYLDNPFEIAIGNAQRCGILVSAAASNSGKGSDTRTAYADMPDYETSSCPALMTDAMSVASTETKKVVRRIANTADGDKIHIMYDDYSVYFCERFSDKPYEYIHCTGTTEEEIMELDTEDKIVLINIYSPETPGPINISSMMTAVRQNGGLGIIFINYDDKCVTMPLSGEAFPCIAISSSDGQKLVEKEIKTLQTQANIVEESDNESGLSWFSSWCTGPSLELKPEISAPGGDVFSSVPYDKYCIMSGTSMSTPHITGAAAILSQYIDENPQQYADANVSNKSLFMQKIMMSTAALYFQESGIPVSPRLQGAGFADLRASTETPVILTGTENKAKISLKQLDENGRFALKFTAENFSDTDAVYNTGLYVFTDDAEKEQNGERYIVNGSKNLKFTSDLPETVTVPAKGETEITVNVALDEGELAENYEVFTNGFWVDGFVTLTATDEVIPDLSIPYTGFYGDWTAASPFGTSYFENMEEPYQYLTSHSGNCVNDYFTHSCAKLGENIMYNYFENNGINLDDYNKADYSGEKFAGYSPNNDGFMDNLCFSFKPVRCMNNVSYTITGEGYEDCIVENEFCSKYTLVTKNDIAAPKDGSYELNISGTAYIEGAPQKTKTLKFYVDTEMPQIRKLSFREDGDKEYLDLSLSDNRYLMVASIGLSGEDAQQVTIETSFERTRILNTAEADVSFDITDMNKNELYITLMDYAGNMQSLTMEAFSIGEMKYTSDPNYILISCNAYNYTGEDIKADVITAIYDAEGRLIGVDAREDVQITAGNSTFSAVFENNRDISFAKCFVWDSISGANPLCSSCEIAID